MLREELRVIKDSSEILKKDYANQITQLKKESDASAKNFT